MPTKNKSQLCCWMLNHMNDLCFLINTKYNNFFRLFYLFHINFNYFPTIRLRILSLHLFCGWPFLNVSCVIFNIECCTKKSWVLSHRVHFCSFFYWALMDLFIFMFAVSKSFIVSQFPSWQFSVSTQEQNRIAQLTSE